MTIRRFVATGLALFAVLFAIGALHGCNALTPAEQAQVASDGLKLSTCASEAHLCKKFEQTGAPDAGLSKCWEEYETCMRAHGFRDAGAEGGK